MSTPDYAEALANALRTFYVEAAEMLGQMEQTLLALEDDEGDVELLNALFRSIHTIKGSAGLFGLSALVGFTHEVETVLDHLRAGRIAASPALSSLLLRCCDHVGRLVDDAKAHGGDTPLPEALAADSAELLAALETFVPTAPGRAAPSRAAEANATADPDTPSVWHVSLRFLPHCHARGIDPLATVRYLQTLGELVLCETIDAHVPPLSEIDPERCYLGFELRLRTAATRQALLDAFEFIEDECEVRIIPPKAPADEYVRLIQDLPPDANRLGEILMACGALQPAELHRALAVHHMESIDAPAPKQLGEVLIEQNLVPASVVDAALKKQVQAREKPEEARVFRVQAEKLDSLIDLVGELVIVSATARNQAAEQPDLLETTHQIGRLVEEIRNSSLALRMVAIGETFARFRRVVRDLAGNLGKEVRLELEGGDTELDKSVVEKIGDPLMHLVRNALDHGLETPVEREAAGKPHECRLRLSAQHDSGSIVITVADDGRGINTARVLEKARARGLVAANATLAPHEVHALIFEPGFSTAETVTDISGRGVGMDVVRQNVEKLRGRIAIRSQEGAGTEIEIRLPLTLAIIDGFLVRSGPTALVIPLEHVEECISAAELREHGGSTVISQRGDPLPVLDVAATLGLPGGAPGLRRSVVVVRSEGKRAGLVVDHLLGEHQTVIKPLGKVFQHIRPLSGSTILGTGEIALILDINELMGRARHRHVQATAPPGAETAPGAPLGALS